MNESVRKEAIDFLENQKQFHLGFLPTEQSNPLTRNLDGEFAASTVRGVKNLQSVDRNVLKMAEKIIKSAEFEKLCTTALNTVKNGGRLIFSGCGATGRLSILLECMWRKCCNSRPQLEKYADQTASIMTGGDYALVKSVEFFEDYQSFGRRQAADLNINENDMLLAITEGGETSSVLGTLFEALERKAKVFLMFNNPADLLAEHLERSRKAICDPGVCVLDLHCGPMALAGSTRMQATSSEQLISGAALEYVIAVLSGLPIPDTAGNFRKLLDALETEENVEAIAGAIDFEAGVYRKKGYITYFAHDYMLDIFTDTTERSPTFMLPPFRKKDDTVSPRPWSFVKDPTLTTGEVWQYGMMRALRCLQWDQEDYKKLGASDKIKENIPAIDQNELFKFEVGHESLNDRIPTGNDGAVLVTVDGAENSKLINVFKAVSEKFSGSIHIDIGGNCNGQYKIKCKFPETPLNLMEHMAVKLVLNTVSTGIMACLGRISGNWMSYVDVSNKKLIDRAIRLISEIGGVSYEKACFDIFEAIWNIKNTHDNSNEKPSAVQYVLQNYRKQQSLHKNQVR